VFRGFAFGRKKYNLQHAKNKRMRSFGLEGDIVDILQDNLLNDTTREEACRAIVILTKGRSPTECRAFIELGFFKAVADQLKALKTNSAAMECLTCLDNLLPGFHEASPEPTRTHIVRAVNTLLSSTSSDEIEVACRYISSVSGTAATRFPNAFVNLGVQDTLVDLLMNPLNDELYVTDFPFALAAHVKSWTQAGGALLDIVRKDSSLIDTEVVRDGVIPAVMSAMVSILDALGVCGDGLLGEAHNAALINYVGSSCLDAIPVLTSLHREIFLLYAFTNSEYDAQLTLLAEQLMRTRGSSTAHEHALYLLDIMCNDLKAAVFLLKSGIPQTMELLLKVYPEGNMRATLEKVALKLTNPILAPTEAVVPFAAATQGREEEELEEVVKEIREFHVSKEECASRSGHLLLKALEEQQ